MRKFQIKVYIEEICIGNLEMVREIRVGRKKTHIFCAKKIREMKKRKKS